MRYIIYLAIGLGVLMSMPAAKRPTSTLSTAAVMLVWPAPLVAYVLNDRQWPDVSRGLLVPEGGPPVWQNPQ